MYVNMKIGIFTFHRARNYGAFLQAFALKKFLKDLDHQVDIIDYWPRAHEYTYKLIKWNKSASFKGKIAGFIYSIINFPLARKRKRIMDFNVRQCFDLSQKPKFIHKRDLKDIKYDCIIYGSDQIWWNSTIIGYEGLDPVYWGEYIDKKIKKIAYAPSMGLINLNDQLRNQIKSYLENFSHLSVREIDLRSEILDLTSKSIEVVLDPVFLLNKEYWESLCLPLHNQKYILYYSLMHSKEAVQLVNKLSEDTGYKIIEITGRVDPFKYGKKYVQTASAFDFISLIHDAEIVVSTSFHGVAFSIIFEKQFFALGMQNNSGRVKSLLKILNISDRMLQNINDISNYDIDYSAVTEKLKIQINKSETYLSKSILD